MKQSMLLYDLLKDKLNIEPPTTIESEAKEADSTTSTVDLLAKEVIVVNQKLVEAKDKEIEAKDKEIADLRKQQAKTDKEIEDLRRQLEAKEQQVPKSIDKLKPEENMLDPQTWIINQQVIDARDCLLALQRNREITFTCLAPTEASATSQSLVSMKGSLDAKMTARQEMRDLLGLNPDAPSSYMNE